jgi:cytochrome c oxidase subunit II
MVVLMRVLIALSACLAAVGLTPSPQTPEREPQVQTVDVSAERYTFTPSEIRTTVGTTLRIRLRSDDTTHGFRIVGTSTNIEIPKRGSSDEATVDFTPDHAGRYEFQCSKLCGAGHSFMRGVIVAKAAEARR